MKPLSTILQDSLHWSPSIFLEEQEDYRINDERLLLNIKLYMDLREI